MNKHYVINRNKKATFNFFIETTFEAGIVLSGEEVKSLRAGKGNIEDSHAHIERNELWLLNSFIAEYKHGSKFASQSERRPRKLLLNRKEINKIQGKIKQQGYTLIALSMYFNQKNKVKVEIAIAKGKKLYDKRETLKERDWNRQKGNVLRDAKKM